MPAPFTLHAPCTLPAPFTLLAPCTLLAPYASEYDEDGNGTLSFEEYEKMLR